MPVYSPPFVLIRLDGQTIEFGDLVALACAVRAARITVAPHHISYDWRGARIEHAWIVRDAHGHSVPEEAIWEVSPCRIMGYRPQTYLNQAQHASALGLPIPHTGRRSSYGRMLRHMRTLATNRARVAARIEDRRAEIRPKGRIGARPTCWDDIPRSLTRSWKAHRKTQWRDVPGLD